MKRGIPVLTRGRVSRPPTWCKQRLIIIGEKESLLKISDYLATHYDVLAFETVEEFERWSHGQSPNAKTLQREVDAAIAAIGTRACELPSLLRDLLGRLARQTRAPAIEGWIGGQASRRSFYRAWAAHLAETPARFLARVRTLHAARLIQEGMCAKEAALVSGFTSSAQLHRALAKL